MAALTIEPRALRNALGAFATGVTIVTTRGADGSDVGLTANSFSSVSLDPPMVLWSLAKTAGSIDAFRQNGHFAVHVLAADQVNLSSRFASRGVDRFAGIAVERGPGNVPLLDGCAARFECRTAFQYDGGDHVIFVAEVVNLTHSECPPLVFHGGRYGMIIKKEAAPLHRVAELESGLSPDDLTYHVSRAFYKIRQEAHDERKRRGWTDAEYAALVVLGRENGKSVSEIDAMSTLRGSKVNPEVVANLAARGFVTAAEPVQGDTVVHLTPAGRQGMIEMIAILKASEADALEGFDFSEIHVLKELLQRLVDKSESVRPATALRP